MKIVNIKLKEKAKDKIIIIKKLLDEDIMLTIDLIKTKNLLMKKISWIASYLKLIGPRGQDSIHNYD